METGNKIIATITEVKGHCTAGHKAGDTFEISCHNTAGLCGFFYHNIFPNLSTFQYGGQYPWWRGDTLFLKCPDPVNQVSIKLEKVDSENTGEAEGL
ncbi:MAG: TIGR04076 family protein [Bacillota bacterium]|nr:TIGR04076 family protein [Bacillota bacterium]